MKQPISCFLMQYYGAVICAFFLLSFTLLWAGLFSFDTGWQWEQAQSGIFDNLHPPMMAWWWRVLNNYVMHDRGILLLFHLVIFWWGLYLLGKELGRVSPWLAYLCIAIWLTPPMFTMTAAVWKDTSMTCTFLLAVALMFRATLQRQALSIPATILIILLLIYGVGVRYNALFALPPLCLLLARGMTPHESWKKLSVLAALLFIIIVGLASLLNRNITNIHTEAKQQVLLVQLAGMSQITNKFLFPDSFLARYNMTKDELSKKIVFHYQFTNTHHFRTGNREETRELQQALLTTIYEHPWSYVRYRTTMMQHVLGWNVKPFWAYMWPNNSKIFVKQIIGNYLQACKSSFWFRPWVFLFGNFVLFLIAVWQMRKRIPAITEILLITTSGICYVLPYFFIAPSADFRYHYWMVMCCLVGILLTGYSWGAMRTNCLKSV